MAYVSASGGGDGQPAPPIHTDANHPDSVNIPDAELLFTGDFRREGPDLILTGHDGRRHIVPDYFAGEKHPALVAPNGASLSGDLIDLLAGSPAPGQYAQAQPTAPANPIGKIEKVVGHAVITRNGVAVALNVGDAIYKSDVIQTGNNSSVGISFPDGTALNLVANTRMALNEYSYEPNGASNSALFSLVEGTFAFVAGQVAHTGDGMKIATPVATMGIRGTAGWAGHQMPLVSSNFGNVYAFALAHDPGVDTFGRYALYATDLNGNLILDQNGDPIVRDTVANLDTLALCSIDRCTDEPMTSALSNFGQGIMQGAYDASHSASPGSTGGNGSGDPPFLLQTPQFFQEDGNGFHPFYINFTINSGTNNQGTVTPSNELPPVPPPPTTPTITITTIETNNTLIETNSTFIETNNIINIADAAAGIAISGTVTGSSDNGQTVTVDIVNGSNVVVDSYTTTVSNGTWSVDVTKAQAQALADGSYTVAASVSNATGDSAQASQPLTVDETAPTIAIKPIDGNDIINASEAAQSGGVTISGAATHPLINGNSAINGQTVTVDIVNGSNVVVDSYTTTVSNGTWSVDVTKAQAQALGDGSYTVTASVSDAAGNPAQETQVLTVDETSPVITAPSTATIGVNQTDAITGVSLSESGNALGETFTVTLKDSNGVLSATDTGGVGNTVSSPGTTLTISGTLSEVNADLATLKDTDSTATAPGSPETITVSASDSFDNIAAPQTIDVTVNGEPSIAATTPSQTIGVNQTDAITGVSLSESGNALGETFTVTLKDSNGVLSATDTGGVGNTVSSPGTTLTISGTLSEVNADLATLKDTDSTATAPGSPETITVSASDSFDNIAAPQTIDVTVNGEPSIAATTPSQTIGVNQTDAITGVSLSESGNALGETFTVTLKDSNGVLSATDTGGVGNTVSSPGTTLTISGTLSEVNADLATLKDTDSTATAPGSPETITVSASDSFDNIAAPQTIDVTVNGEPSIAATTPSQTIGVNQTDAITGISLSESGNALGETFTVTLKDSNGVLSATDTGGVGNTVSSPGTTLTISGTLSEVNADLATLKDTDSTATAPGSPETITVSASDSFDNIAAPQTIDVTVNGEPSIAATTPSQTIGVNQTDAITGISLSESGNALGETFTVTLKDSNGVLSATDTGGVGNTVSSPGTTLTISGTLSEVNADLATLKDTDSTATAPGSPETITVSASDSFDNIAAPQTIDVTVNGEPSIAATTPSQTIGVNQTDAITGISLSESGNALGETFTVTLKDSNGVLSATDTGGVGNTVSSPGTTLTISGTLSEVNADLATLKDTDSTATAPGSPETITVSASDSFDNIAAPQTIDVTVNGEPSIAATTPSQTIGVNQTDAITGISLSESGNALGETFTVTLKDSNGVLSATDTGGVGNTVSSPGTTLTISGTLSEVNADLATLKDTDSTATAPGSPETITVSASDSFDNIAAPQTIDVTVNGEPSIAATTPSQTIGVNQTDAITGISLSESGNALGETFTVTLKDSNGVLSATDTGGVGNTVSSPGTTLTISGTLSEVNADLATLKDTDSTATAPGSPETITVSASDSFDNIAAPQTIDVTVNGEPSIAATTPSQTIGVNQTDAITGISLSESGNALGETFTVTLKDSNGVLSATDTGGVGNTVSSPGTTLTISGTLSEVNADLATLKDTDSTATAPGSPETITVSASDSFDNIAAPQTIDVTVNGEPSIAATTPSQTIGVNQTDAITGISLSESGNALGETFTVTLKDSNGVLSATDTGGVGNTVSSPGTTLTISGTLSEVNADLATLKDTDSTATAPGSPETITVSASDSFDNIAAPQTIDVTVNGEPSIAATTPSQTIGVNQTDAITGISLSESGNALGETFTVTLKDSNGVLSATDTGGVGNTVSSPGTTLTISGTLSEVNADLATLKDTDSTATAPGSPETITVSASDSFDNIAAPQTIDVTVNGEPSIAATTPSQTIGVNQTDAITGISLSESGNALGETFTVTLKDSNGVLSATDTGGVGNTVSSPGTTLTISGTLSEVNADLATLKDTDSTATAPGSPETITVSASDSFDNIAAPQTIDVTVNGEPSIAATTPSQTIGVNQTDAITGVSLSESGNALGETFTVTLKDSNGVLSATDTGGVGNTVSSPGTTLTISGTLSEVNADLATLKDTDSTATAPGSPETITVSASDSFDNIAAPQTIAVTAIDTTTVSEEVSALGAPLNLVTNGGFEIGNLTGWTLGGNDYYSTVPPQAEIFITSSYFGTPDTHSGQYAIALGSVGLDGTLSQTIQTIPGQQYTLSFWLENEQTSSTDNFTVTWDGQTLLALTSAPAEGYTLYTYTVTATGSNSLLEFAARQDPSQWNLDDVSVIPAGAETSLNGFVSVSDTPSIDDTLTTTLTVLYGKITVAAPGGAIIGGDDSSSVTLTGTAAEINAALATASYIPTPGYGSDSLTVTTTDPISISSNNTVTQTVPITVTSVADSPAGVAGNAINLALANPAAANGTPVTITVTGVPSDWSLNEGTDLGNGTWTIQTDDPSSLTVVTAAAYAGAMVLSVTESWTSANSSTGIATVADNVEAYAPGAPIFALSGNDTLSGAGGNDEFVFAQPFGNDTIYNFNVATDKIDLLAFTNVASFSDIQSNIVEDSSGDAVIMIGAGETITLHGVNASSLTPADFVFNQTPVVDNGGTMAVSDGAILPLGGTINNSGTIALNSTGDQTELQVIGDGITLQGGGKLTLSDSSANIILGTTSTITLTNVDNTISGVGQIGSGDGTLTLVNDTHGTIDANVAGGTLNLDTGNTDANDGLLEATSGGTLHISDSIANAGGTVEVASGSAVDIQGAITGGNAIIAGGTLAFDYSSAVNVTFDNGQNGTAYGELVLSDPSQFSGQISGFTGTAANAAHSDVIELIGFTETSYSEQRSGGNLTLTLYGGGGNVTLTLDNFSGSLNISTNSQGDTIITDPPATASATAESAIALTDGAPVDLSVETVALEGSGHVGGFTLDPPRASNGSASVAWFDPGNDKIQLTTGQTVTQSHEVTIAEPQNSTVNVNQTASVTIGGPGNDNFMFAPGVGADNIIKFNPQHDAIELDNLANIQSIQQLPSLIATNAHGDAVIEVGHSDGITIPGVSAGYLQAHLQSLAHLH